MTTFVSKETISRLLKDVKQILKHPLIENGIYYIHDDTDMLKGYALIIGPSDTPYFGGNYFFDFTYPTDYPHRPPIVKYYTNRNNIRFNPNLYTCGKVCISILNTWRGEQWSSCQTISTILLTLCTLLNENPLLNEPGVDDNHQDNVNYKEIISYANIDIAVCDILQKKKGIILPFFDYFDIFVKDNFLKNVNKLLEISEKKLNEYNNSSKILKTGFYSLNVEINYEKLIQKIKNTQELLLK